MKSITFNQRMMFWLSLMLSGRAMTLAYIHRAGGSDIGDPPSAWLMPLIGDAAVGITAFYIAWLIWNKRGLWVWTTMLVWNVVAIWDALSAFIIHLTNPWPEFFMIKVFGPTMFFAASLMHLLILLLLCQKNTRDHYLTNSDMH